MTSFPREDQVFCVEEWEREGSELCLKLGNLRVDVKKGLRTSRRVRSLEAIRV